MVLEMASVGQCEVFVWFDFYLFPLGGEAHGSKNGVPIFKKKNVYFSVTYRTLNLANGKHFCFFPKVKMSQIQ